MKKDVNNNVYLIWLCQMMIRIKKFFLLMYKVLYKELINKNVQFLSSLLDILGKKVIRGVSTTYCIDI